MTCALTWTSPWQLFDVSTRHQTDTAVSVFFRPHALCGNYRWMHMLMIKKPKQKLA
jgi:hypothetical protein